MRPPAPGRLHRRPVRGDVAARLAGDIGEWNQGKPDKTNSCEPISAGHRFPAGQIVVNAANSGRSDITLTLTANPRQPEAVQPGWESRKVTALIAYLQRLGTDLYATPPVDQTAQEAAHAAR